MPDVLTKRALITREVVERHRYEVEVYFCLLLLKFVRRFVLIGLIRGILSHLNYFAFNFNELINQRELLFRLWK